MSKEAAVLEPPSSPVERKALLAECEAKIEQAETVFLEAGVALRRISEGQLYVDGYSTFENYVWQRWTFIPRRAYQLIDAAIVAEMCTAVQTPIPNEAVARELAQLKKEPTRLVAAWKALSTLGVRPTGPQARKVVEAVKGAPADAVTGYARQAIVELKRATNGATQKALPSGSAPAPEVETQEELNTQRFFAALDVIKQLPPAPVFFRSVPIHLSDGFEKVDYALRYLQKIDELHKPR